MQSQSLHVQCRALRPQGVVVGALTNPLFFVSPLLCFAAPMSYDGRYVAAAALAGAAAAAGPVSDSIDIYKESIYGPPSFAKKLSMNWLS